MIAKKRKETVHKLIEEIKSNIKDAIVTSNVSSNGRDWWMLNIKLGSRFFVIEHDGQAGYGVTEIVNEPEHAGHDNVFPEIGETLKYFYDQVSKSKEPKNSIATLSL